MTKQENTTVYYCDKCRTPVIGTPAVIKSVDYCCSANGVSISDPRTIEELPLRPNEINTFHIVTLEPEGFNMNMAQQTGCFGVKSVPRTKHLCARCAENVEEKYMSLVKDLADLFNFN